MEMKIHDLKERIERKRAVLCMARNCERSGLEEEIADLEIELRLLEITKANSCR
ncbi:MAG: hypothetical protein JST49_09735 [Bacteroidetes bacterium]|nr:hypothetical protein [Bacteroidota bacterium]